jgi:hypothetical protein
MWKEADVAYFEVLSRYLPGRTEENHDSTDSRCPSPDLNQGSLDHEGGKLSTGKLDDCVFCCEINAQDLKINFRIVTTCQKHYRAQRRDKPLARTEYALAFRR